MKKVVSLLLVVIITVCVPFTAFAENDDALAAGDTLHALGLFSGKGSNADGSPRYDLESAPTRSEAITMLVALLGKYEEARSTAWNTPFTDVADWAKPYVGYAYANGLTYGTSATTFGGDDLITATQYLTFILSALGYSNGTDFKWNAAWELTDSLEITHGEYTAENNKEFTRGDVTITSANTLPVAQKDSTESLADKLMKDGVFTEEQYKKAFHIEEEDSNNAEAPNTFDIVAFLMSYDPSSIEYGKAGGTADHYFYENRYIAEEMASAACIARYGKDFTRGDMTLERDYQFSDHSKAEGMLYCGTRVELSVKKDRVFFESFWEDTYSQLELPLNEVIE